MPYVSNMDIDITVHTWYVIFTTNYNYNEHMLVYRYIRITYNINWSRLALFNNVCDVNKHYFCRFLCHMIRQCNARLSLSFLG